MKKSVKLMYPVVLSFLGITAISCSSDDANVEPIDPANPRTAILDPADLRGSVAETARMDATKTYHLTGILSVEEGATLTIPAGTKIVANTDADENPATGVYIVVQKGGKINIQGTATAPVVMSSASGEAGSWGGLVIAGNGITTAGLDATAEVGGILYGGDDAEDNSGSISYLVLRDAGAQINAESQYNGLSLYAVGAATKINNIAIINGSDDGVEFFGGSVSATNIYLENNEDDAVDWTEGWNGTVENVYVSHSIENFSTALEADGANGNPTINNFTAVSTTGGTALQFKKQSGATITGLSLAGYDTQIDITEAGRTDLSGIKIEGEDADLNASYDADVTVDIALFNWVE